MINRARLYSSFYKFFLFLAFPAVFFAAGDGLERLGLDPGVVARVRAIGAIVRPIGFPTCFIARSHDGEDPGIRGEQDKIHCFLRGMGIRTIFDVDGDFRRSPIGGHIGSILAPGHFVLCLFTPNGLAHSSRKSVFAAELNLIRERLGDDRSNFLIPVLMAGNIHTAVPEDFKRLLYCDATTRGGVFDITTFCREIWPLFAQRIFIQHPQFIHIRPHLQAGAEALGLTAAFSLMCECPGKPPYPPITTSGVKNWQKYYIENSGVCHDCQTPLIQL